MRTANFRILRLNVDAHRRAFPSVHSPHPLTALAFSRERNSPLAPLRVYDWEPIGVSYDDWLVHCITRIVKLRMAVGHFLPHTGDTENRQKTLSNQFRAVTLRIVWSDCPCLSILSKVEPSKVASRLVVTFSTRPTSRVQAG